jgi:NDP-sugar pyrophosphorylase family protein
VNPTIRAVIMAGGEGARLRPFTYSIPKPLLPIGRKPIAQIIVERLRDCGIRDIVMSVNYGADLIRAFFQDGAQFGVSISYYQEAQRLGTAGCLAHIPGLREGGLVVTNGDILTVTDYAQFVRDHAASGAALTVATRRETMTIPYGVLELDGDTVRSVEEKPTMAYCFSAGIYALSPAALDLVPSDRAFDMTELVNALAAAGEKVRAAELEGIWYDLARAGDFDRALAEIEESAPELFGDVARPAGDD